MKLAKAIELLERADIPKTKERFPEFYDALKLGIEALKRTISNRQVYWGAAYVTLPGETEE